MPENPVRLAIGCKNADHSRMSESWEDEPCRFHGSASSRQSAARRAIRELAIGFLSGQEKAMYGIVAGGVFERMSSTGRRNRCRAFMP